MRIGTLAARAGVPASRVRFYEAEGLLPEPARRDSGYRDYDEAALVDLKLIGRGQRLGYSLKDIAKYLSLPDEDDRQAYLVGCVDGRLAEVDGELEGLKAQKASLERMRRGLRS
jgi:MerR family copper efflux transcriptional regulator